MPSDSEAPQKNAAEVLRNLWYDSVCKRARKNIGSNHVVDVGKENFYSYNFIHKIYMTRNIWIGVVVVIVLAAGWWWYASNTKFFSRHPIAQINSLDIGWVDGTVISSPSNPNVSVTIKRRDLPQGTVWNGTSENLTVTIDPDPNLLLARDENRAWFLIPFEVQSQKYLGLFSLGSMGALKYHSSVLVMKVSHIEDDGLITDIRPLSVNEAEVKYETYGVSSQKRFFDFKITRNDDTLSIAQINALSR